MFLLIWDKIENHHIRENKYTDCSYDFPNCEDKILEENESEM